MINLAKKIRTKIKACKFKKELLYLSDYINNNVPSEVIEEVRRQQHLDYTTEQENKYACYINQIENPSKDFECFLTDYFIGHPMIRGRHEEDITVWQRLKGQELLVAKQMILDNMGRDSSYMLAINEFRDERGISLLLDFLEKNKNETNFSYERLTAAKILYDWIGYTEYLDLLEKTLPKSSEYTKISLDQWVNNLDPNLAERYIFMMLTDKNSFVRFCALGTFIRYYNISENLLESRNYYIDDEVYRHKKKFKKRLEELKQMIK